MGRTARRAFALCALCALPIAVSGAQEQRVRVRRDSTARDTGLVRFTVSGDSIAVFFKELVASRQLEELIVSALREAAGQGRDPRRIALLERELGEIAKRRSGLFTKIEMQCSSEPLPDGYLGISYEEEAWDAAAGRVPSDLGIIMTVAPGSPAERAGIRRGDVLVSIGGVDSRRPPEQRHAMLKPGARVPVKFRRDGAAREVVVLVEKRPADFGSPCASARRYIDFEETKPPAILRSPQPGAAPRAIVPSEVPTPPPGQGSFTFAWPMPAALGFGGASVMRVDDDYRARLGVDDGIVVTRVPVGSPARESGLRLLDVIVQADGQPVSSTNALSRILRNARSNAIQLSVIRDGKPTTVTFRMRTGEP